MNNTNENISNHYDLNNDINGNNQIKTNLFKEYNRRAKVKDLII